MPAKNGKTILFDSPLYIKAYASAVGDKEGNGPLGDLFDIVFEDFMMGQKSFEKAEAQLQKAAVGKALEKAGLESGDIDYIMGGDLLNQCIGSSYGLRDFGIPFLGLYGACSTMAEGMGLASLICSSGAAKNCVAVSSSHFCSAERQFRFPLNYGGQRTPTSQWTVTGSGAVVISSTPDKKSVRVRAVTFGTIEDLGVTDINNMGAAMAPVDVKIRLYPTAGFRRYASAFHHKTALRQSAVG